MRPFIIGRDARERDGIWRDWRRVDRWWHHLPIYSYGPLDCCLWLLAAQAAGQPLWRYLGGSRDRIDTYASSLVLEGPDAYAAEVRAVQAAGMRGYKIIRRAAIWTRTSPSTKPCAPPPARISR